MYKQLKKNQGFTIIEVMIVLAVAGLILLIVFLAVPALQRTTRNTNMKNDASAVAAAITDFESNNNGTLPAAVSQTSSSVTIGGGTHVTSVARVQTSDIVTLGSSEPTTLSVGDIEVVPDDICNAAVSTTSNPSDRSVAVYYAVETGSGGAGIDCIQS